MEYNTPKIMIAKDPFYQTTSCGHGAYIEIYNIVNHPIIN